MKKKGLPFVIFIGLAFQSCVMFHDGFISNLSDASTKNNYRLIGKVMGVSEATTVFCFGNSDLKHSGLTAEAMNDLKKNYPLKAGQGYQNISVDFVSTSYWVAKKTTCHIMADIIQLINNTADTSSFTTDNKSCKMYQPIKLESVKDWYGKNCAYGKIVFMGEDNATVKYFDTSEVDIRITVPYQTILTKKKKRKTLTYIP